VVRFETWDKQQLKPSGAPKQAELLITGRLRAQAAAIRSGHEPAALPSAPPEPDRHLETPPPERHVLFLQPARYTGRGGLPVLCTAWSARVPPRVAEAAIKQGLALDADTDAAREKMKEMAERRWRVPQRLGRAVTIEDTIDLGVNLAEELEPSEISGAA
jgi:hypothetical protein